MRMRAFYKKTVTFPLPALVALLSLGSPLTRIRRDGIPKLFSIPFVLRPMRFPVALRPSHNHHVAVSQLIPSQFGPRQAMEKDDCAPAY